MINLLKELIQDLKNGEIEYMTIKELHQKIFALETAIEILEKRDKR